MDSFGFRGAEQNNPMCYEQKKLGVVGEGQGLGSSDEDRAMVNVGAAHVNGGPGRDVSVHNGLQIPQQEAQGPVILWERFLPKRSLKVLVVENDDSTRQIVTALLRNCSYEVTAVANGLQAWRILEDLTNPIDLVLTEVVMPFVSGISLLYKIMSHKTLKNIPVIMMSSHDSMGIVFKCLSKGAVDFLGKPIRKNELKNLWQHVWRRCHFSSGSGTGSESGTQTKKYTQFKSNDESDNNTVSSDEHDNGSKGMNFRDGSDNGSGTQSSWTKRAAEVDSPQPVSPWEQSGDAPDSTCAQVIQTKPETVIKGCVHVTETIECQEQDKQLDLDLRVSGNSDSQHRYPQEELSAHLISRRHPKVPELDNKPHDRSPPLEPNSENKSGNIRDQAPHESCAIENSTNPQAESRTFDAPSGLFNISEVKKLKAKYDSEEFPSVELTLKRRGGVGDAGAIDDCNVLRHSDQSAFSKYNTASSANQGPTGNIGSCSPLDNSSVATKTERMQNFPSQSHSMTPNQQLNESTNNNKMGSSKYVPLKQEALNDKSESAFKCFYLSAFQSVQNGHICPPQQVTPEKAEHVDTDTVSGKPRSPHQQFQVQHHHHYYHHFHHHVHQQSQLQPDHDDPSEKNTEATAPQCGSSNVYRGPIEGNTRNYSVNGSASGSNHGSNGQYGSNRALHAEPVNIESDNGTAENSGKVFAHGVIEDRVAQREAALTKFRQKRKDRCFGKKVRYQSRKRLAEQRPRLRGQFARQSMSDAKSAKDHQNNDLKSEDNSCDSAQ